MAASSIGLLIGASFGAACLGGHLAKSSNTHENAQKLTQIALFTKASPAINAPVTEAVAEAYDAASATGEARPEMNPTAMMIALRYAPYASEAGSNSLVAQNLTALRTSLDARAQKAEVVRTSLIASTQVLSDHPIMEQLARPAPAMVFKAHTTNDSDCLTQAVYYEARGEGEDGMRAVAQVILNRVRHPAFPKTICGVVYQGAYLHTGCQFSFACDGSMAGPVEAWAWRRAKSVAAAALNGYVMKSVGTATHFHTLSVDPRWSGNMVKIATVGAHVFYQFQGRNAQIRNADGVEPSTEMPSLIQAAETVADGQDGGASIVQVANSTAQPAGTQTAAQAPMAQRPVTLAARAVGRSAEDIIA
ncbi:MAG: cell wall hydrolase, partial [Asticcacaulis sp.]